MLPFMPDFALVQQQFTRWWKRENTRPLVYAPSTWPTPEVLPPPPDDPRDGYLDAATIVSRQRAFFRHVTPGGVYFPFYCPFPPTAGFYGAVPTFTQHTIWHQPILEGNNPFSAVQFTNSNPLWQETVAMYRQLVELADGHFFVSLPNCYSPLDLLEALRGGTRLCLDLIDRADEVKAAQEVILAAWRTMYDTCYAIHQQRYTGATPSFLPAWAPGRSYTLQCDFCCMISAAMFEEFVVPEVVAQAQYVDYSLFHLDGPDAARHVDMLLDIPELHGIQWQKGVNGGATLSWVPLLRKIQQAGKVVMVDGRPEEIIALSQALAPEGLLLCTACDTPEEAKALIARITC